MAQPNVLMFVCDGLRADALGCYGNPFSQTPNLDAFAAEGVRFDQAYCCHSVCMPTRATIYTGRYPHVHGVWANGVALPRDEVTLGQTLLEEGYATCATGKVHFEPQEHYPDRVAPIIESTEPYYGFGEVHLSENSLGREYLQFIRDRYPELEERARKRDRLPEEAHDLTWITSQAIDFMQRQGQAGQPFLCHCSFHELIPPCTPPEGFVGLFDPADMPMPRLKEEDLDRKPPFYRQCYEGYEERGRNPDEATLRQWIAGYYDQLAFIDKQFGRLVQALKEAGLWDDTVVLFTADHGLSLMDHWQWRHGPFLFDEVIHIPMIWRDPKSQGGAVCEEMVEQVDIMPTVLDLCGRSCPPTGVQGQSMSGLIAGKENAWGKDSVLVQERKAPDLEVRGVDPETINQLGVRTRDWKLITYHDYPHGELYDLRADPGEFNNLWYDPAYLSQRREMEALLLERLQGSLDPLPERHAGW